MNKIFKFCGSLQLAMLLLAGIMVMSAVGTVQESTFSAEVAKKYVYNSTFFDLWMLVLVVNLFCAAAVRYPWKPHQTGFVITHAGIIVLLIGGFIDRHWGIEGFISLDRGEAHTDIMELDVQDVVVREVGKQPATYRINLKEFKGHSGELDFAVNSPDPEIKVKLLDTYPPAAKIVLAGAKMGRFDYWLFQGDNQNMGPAAIRFVKGMPPTPAPKVVGPDGDTTEKAPRLERFFVFAKHPQPIAKAIQGQPTNAGAVLDMGEDGNTPVLKLKMNNKDFTFDVKASLNKRVPLEGLSDWQVYIFAYFPNFVMGEDNKPANRNQNPENPAITFELQGPLVPVTDKPADDHNHGPAAGPMSDPTANNLTLYLGPDGVLRYFVKSRAKGESAGEVKIGEPVAAGWAGDATFTIERYVPAEFTKAREEDAKKHEEFVKANTGARYVSDMPSPDRLKNRPLGVLLRLENKGQTRDVWVPIATYNFRRSETIDFAGKQLELSLMRRAVQLPFRIGLERFIAERQPGQSAMYSSFESTLSFQDKADPKKGSVIDPPVQLDYVRVKDPIAIEQLGRERAQPPLPGEDPSILLYRCAIIKQSPLALTVTFPDKHEVELAKSTVVDFQKNTHNISMNRPTVYPVTWWGPWLGTSYKFSQANHDDGRADHSGLQVLRDPGWFFKWVGCLAICFGIFTMFYLKPYFNRPRAKTLESADGSIKDGKKQKKNKMEVSHA